LQAVFFGQHGFHPQAPVLDDGVNHLLQQLSAKAFALEYLADFFLFAFGYFADVLFFGFYGRIDVFLMRLDRFVVACGHAETVRQQVGQAQDERHRGGEAGANSAGNHGKSGHAAVDAAQHGIGDILRWPPRLQPCPDGFGEVFSVKPGTRWAFHAAIFNRV
jgi:hypothetical protein